MFILIFRIAVVRPPYERQLNAWREVLLEHVVGDLLGPGAVDLEHLVGVWVVGVQPSELTFSIPEQDEKMWAV